MSRSLNLTLWIGLISIALVGCGSTPPIPDDNYYRLAKPENVPRVSSSLDGILLIDTPRASGLRRGSALVYSEDPGHLRFKSYHYHHWDEPPAELIRTRLIGALRRAGVASRVDDHASGRPDFRLRSVLKRFDRLIDGDSGTVAIELGVLLVDASDLDEPLLRRNYEQIVTISGGNSMEDTVRAFSRGIDAIVADLIADIERSAAEQEGS